MREVINKLFTWSGMGSKMNKKGNRGMCMQGRPVVTQLFSKVALDLVGPLPKARHGVQYLLTYCCMATRWPEAVPLEQLQPQKLLTG